MAKRVVITGMGVVSPNGVGLADFLEALKQGKSGIRHVAKYEELQMSCHVAGVPEFEKEGMR